MSSLPGNRLLEGSSVISTVSLALSSLLILGCPGADAPADSSNSSIDISESPPVADWEPPGPGFVVWESNRTGAWRLWIRRLDGSGLRQLTPDEGRRAHCCPHVRPDGSGIAYLSLEPGPETYRDGPELGVLRLISIDGSATRALADGARTYGEHRAGIWHDDRRFVFLDDAGFTVRIDVETEAREQLTDAGDEVSGWLPNRQLTHATTGVPTFSPFAAGRGATELQTLSGCQPYFSPDGRWGYWTAGAGGPIDKMELASRTVSEVLAKNDPRIPGRQGYLYFPMLSPDMRLLAFAASAGEHNHFTADYDVYVVEMDPRRLELAGVPVRMTDDPGTDRFPDVFLEALPLGAHDGEVPMPVWLSIPRDTAASGNWTWDLGDGETGSGIAVAHTYETAGSYTVTARSGERRLDGRVRAHPARPPELISVDVRDGRRALLQFDEPIEISHAKLRLASENEVANVEVGAQGRSLVAVLASAIDEEDVLTVEGLRDRAWRPNVAPAFDVELIADAWPSRRDGLVFLWQSAEALNLVEDPSGVGRSFRTERTGLARVDHFFRADLGGGALVASDEAARWAVERIRDRNALTLEATIAARRIQDAPIVALSAGQRKRRNLVLAQRGEELELTLLTSGWGAVEQRVRLGRMALDRPAHLIVSYRPGQLRAWIDGKPAKLEDGIQGDFFQWKVVPLRLGDEAGGGASWQGTLEGVAVYARALEAGEALENARRHALLAARRPEVERVRLRARLVARSEIPTLTEITPYREALAVFEYAVEEVLDGRFDGSRMRVAHWVLLDGERTPEAGRGQGREVELVVEPFASNPQLDGAVLRDTVARSSTELFFAVR